MLKPYTDRLIAIREMLKSPLPGMVQEAYEPLYQLILEFKGNHDFDLELDQVAEKYPTLVRELEARYHREKEDSSGRVEMELPIDKFEYDVFISYSHKNEEWVQNILFSRLEAEKKRVCIDFRDFEPGAPNLTEMERAVLQSRKTILVLTPNYLNSEWGEFENILAQTLDPAARARRVLPIFLERCNLPPRLQTLVYLDFTNPDKIEFQFNRLMRAISR